MEGAHRSWAVPRASRTAKGHWAARASQRAFVQEHRLEPGSVEALVSSRRAASPRSRTSETMAVTPPRLAAKIDSRRAGRRLGARVGIRQVEDADHPSFSSSGSSSSTFSPVRGRGSPPGARSLEGARRPPRARSRRACARSRQVDDGVVRPLTAASSTEPARCTRFHGTPRRRNHCEVRRGTSSPPAASARAPP